MLIKIVDFRRAIEILEKDFILITDFGFCDPPWKTFGFYPKVYHPSYAVKQGVVHRNLELHAKA